MADNPIENIIKVAAYTHAPIETAVFSAAQGELEKQDMPALLQLALAVVVGGLFAAIADKIIDGVTS